MKRIFSFLSLLVMLLFPSTAHAVCPVCTIAVAGGLGISRWLGIDDSVTGIWIGGLILSSGFWLADWIIKRKWKVPYTTLTAILLFYLFVIPPLYWAQMIGIQGNALWGIDKVLLGTGVGSIVFLLGVYLDKWLRTTNNGTVYVYFQKVIIPVFLLTVASYIFYTITL